MSPGHDFQSGVNCRPSVVSALRAYCFARGSKLSSNNTMAFIFTVLTVVKVLLLARDQSGLDYRIATIQLNVTGQLKTDTL